MEFPDIGIRMLTLSLSAPLFLAVILDKITTFVGLIFLSQLSDLGLSLLPFS